MSRRSSFCTPKKSTWAVRPSSEMDRTLPGTPRHMEALLLSGLRGRGRHDRLAEGDSSVPRGYLTGEVYIETARELAQQDLGEPGVLEDPSGEDHRQPSVDVGPHPDQLRA